MRTTLALTVLLTACSLAACDKAASPAGSASSPAPPPSTAKATTSTSTGVAECDDYLARYEACLAAKVPAEAQAMLKQSLASTREAWAQTLAAGGKDALKSSCEMARNASRASMQAYGCTDF